MTVRELIEKLERYSPDLPVTNIWGEEVDLVQEVTVDFPCRHTDTVIIHTKSER